MTQPGIEPGLANALSITPMICSVRSNAELYFDLKLCVQCLCFQISGDVNKVSIDETNHNLSPIKILSVLPCDTSTPKEQHLTGNERTRTVVASSDPYHKTDFHDQNRELKLTKVEEMDRNQESIPQKLSVQDTPLSSSNVLVPQTLKVESHTNSISSNSSQLPAAITATSDQTKNADLNKASIPQPIKENHFVTKPEEKKTFTDPLSTMSAASPALVPSSSSSSASEISHPLASTFDRTSNHIKEDDIVKGIMLKQFCRKRTLFVDQP